jgi:hypothetical protein
MIPKTPYVFGIRRIFQPSFIVLSNLFEALRKSGICLKQTKRLINRS